LSSCSNKQERSGNQNGRATTQEDTEYKSKEYILERTKDAYERICYPFVIHAALDPMRFWLWCEGSCEFIWRCHTSDIYFSCLYGSSRFKRDLFISPFDRNRFDIHYNSITARFSFSDPCSLSQAFRTLNIFWFSPYFTQFSEFWEKTQTFSSAVWEILLGTSLLNLVLFLREPYYYYL